MASRGFNEPTANRFSPLFLDDKGDDNIENSFWYPVIVAWDRLLYESRPRRGNIVWLCWPFPDSVIYPPRYRSSALLTDFFSIFLLHQIFLKNNLNIVDPIFWIEYYCVLMRVLCVHSLSIKTDDHFLEKGRTRFSIPEW